MGMPTEEELKQALAEAARMREAGEDPHHLAKALLNHDYRLKQLERVMQAVELYLHSGMAVQEHEKLLKTLREAKQAIARSAGVEEEQLGLG